MSEKPEILDKMTDLVFSYRPKSKAKPRKRKPRKVAKKPKRQPVEN